MRPIAQMSPELTRSIRKIPQRLPKPALGRGKLQIAAKRCFYAADVVSTAEVAQSAYVRRILMEGWRVRSDSYRRIRRVLAEIATPIGRSVRGPGRPMLWRFGSANGSKVVAVNDK
jgi:hypothetical protein